MAIRLSRRKIAVYAADQLMKGASAKKVLASVAALLVEAGRTAEQELLVRDIEAELADRGVVVADVVSAHPLSGDIKQQITKMIGTKELQFREKIDPSVLGGVRVDIPGRRFDGTIRRKLTALKAKQV
jgi:F-type H+-transporting ATPase subunit delta